MSKGSNRRPTNEAKYRENYEKVFPRPIPYSTKPCLDMIIGDDIVDMDDGNIKLTPEGEQALKESEDKQ